MIPPRGIKFTCSSGTVQIFLLIHTKKGAYSAAQPSKKIQRIPGDVLPNDKEAIFVVVTDKAQVNIDHQSLKLSG